MRKTILFFISLILCSNNLLSAPDKIWYPKELPSLVNLTCGAYTQSYEGDYIQKEYEQAILGFISGLIYANEIKSEFTKFNWGETRKKIEKLSLEETYNYCKINPADEIWKSAFEIYNKFIK